MALDVTPVFQIILFLLCLLTPTAGASRAASKRAERYWIWCILSGVARAITS